MKHTLYILLAMLIATASAKAQQADSAPDPDTWYQYQKNEGFEAFLLDRVDSIVYSRFDLDSVLHDDVVVQEVWFQGQAQRFLLETIDSIGFYKPETQYCDEVYHLTAFHVPYTIGIDSLTLTFDSSIPSDHLPLVGQVVVSDVRTHPYERGFAGRVRQIDQTTEGIVLVCDRVSIVDIYKQLVAVGHVQATPDDDASNQPGNSRRRVNVEDETYDLITDKEISLPLKVMTIKDKINYSVDYTVNIGMFKKPIVKVYVNGRHELKGTSKLSVDDEKEWDVWPDKLSWYFPIPGLEILTVSLKLGGFAYAGGKMELKGEVPLTLTHQVGFEWEDNELTPIKSFDYEWGDPEVTLDLKGTVRAGIQMQLGINLISDGIVSANITGKIGPQLDADLVLSSDGVRDQSWYQALKDTKGTLSLYTSLDAAFEVFGNDIEDVLDISLTEPWEKNWLKTDRYLLPEFTQPELVPYTPDYADYSLTSMMTVPSRSTLLPVGVGIGMFDRGGNRIAEKWSGQWWTDDPEKPKKVQYDLSTSEGHRTHVFRPIVKLLGMTLDAYPEAEFTVPGKITLAENSLMMNEKTAKIIEITDGWGIYGNATDQQDIVKVSLYGELDGKHYLRLDALQAGETTVAVKDIRTGKIVSIPVKVVDPNALIVNPYNVTVVENQTADVTVKGGSGHYRVSTEDTEKIQAEIDGNTIHITALSPGDAIILVQDNQSDYFANVQVKINATPKSVYLAQSINMTAGDTRNIEISGKNGQVEIYKEADFINISSDNPDVATVRLVPGNTYYMVKVYALKEGVAHVTIEDTTTGDQSVMEVNVGPTSSTTYTVTDGDYTIYTVNGVPFKMINVEGGTFTMGRTPEQAVDYLNSEYYFRDYRGKRLSKLDDYNLDVPAHEETVADFSIGEKQVTWELYKAVMGEGNGDDNSPIRLFDMQLYRFDAFLNRLSEMTGLSFRKPTEAEWEYAARGGKYSKGYKYPGTNDVIAASFGVPNELGISGLVGGYSEACEDGNDRGGIAKACKLDDNLYRWYGDDIIPWISYRGGTGSLLDIGLRLALGGSLCPPKSWVGEDGYGHRWPEPLKVPLWGESSLTFTGGYGEYDVTSKDPEVATGYTQGNKLIAESHSGGNTTLTITDKRNRSSLDVDVSVDYIGFGIRGLDDYKKIPIGIDYFMDSSDNGRFKYNVSDESGIMLSTTPDKKVSIKGLELGKYHVAVTDIGSHKTIEWDTEVIDTLGFDRNYITIREGHTDSVLVTHSNGMISVYCSKDDEYYNIIDESPNGYIYDNVIRITPTEPGVYGIRVNDYALDRVRLQGNYEKYITVIVPDERSEKREQVLSELDKTKILAIQTKKTLGSKATAEQTPDLYNTLFDINANIFCIGAKTESAKILPELEELEAQTEDVRLKLNQLYEQVSQLSQLRTDEDVTEKDICPDDHHPHLIDLGLPSGTKWACCNVGANRVEEIGKYYFWGETEERTEYEYGTYQAPPIFDIEGTSYDVARVKWGEPWQMATNSQWDELLELKRTFTSRNGINGCLIEGNNGNAIFIPTVNSFYDYWGPTGYTGYYWSSTSFRHYYMGKDQLGYYDNMFLNGDFWCSVRPVVPSSGDIPDPQVLELQKQELNSTLQTLLDELELIAQELSMKATEGQAPDLYKECHRIKETCASIASMIDSITSEDDIDKSRADLDAIATRMAALRSQVENYQPIRNIIFVDANVKAICVENWDANGDSELSYDEAAAVTNLGEAFKDNKQITKFEELTFFTGLTSIGRDAFKDCSGLTSVWLPESVTNIEWSAFYGCSSMTSFIIPNSVTSIGGWALAGCRLTSITIPKSVTSIGAALTAECDELTSIVVEEGNTHYDSRNNCNAIIETASNTLVRGCQTTVIPNSVTSLDYDAFAHCSGLTSIDIPNSVTIIGQYAFCDCSNLTAVNIPNSVTKIESNAFSGCSGLTTLDIPNSVTSIGQSAFESCGLTSIIIPNSVTSITNYMFNYCRSLTSVTIPSSVTSIGGRAFNDCNSLISVTVGAESPIAIGEATFSNRRNATLIVPTGSVNAYQAAEYWKDFKNIMEMEAKPTEIDGICYEITDNVKKEVEVIAGRGEGLYFEISIPGSVKIGNELYNVVGLRERALENTGVKSVTIAEGIKRIGYFCFLNTALRELVLPSSIESIETLAFANDPLDKIVSYITNPMAINDNTFDHSYERATLYVPAGSKEKYEATDGWKLFKKIVEMGGEVPPGNIAFADAPVKVVCLENWDTNGDGYLSFEEAAAVKDLGQAFRLNWQITSFDELQYFTGLTNIAEQAFSNCDHLTSVVIPNSVTTIGYAAFNGCTSLTSVTIPESVDTIGGSAFQNCRSLTSVTIPNSVTSIGQTAFSGCKSLTSINIPESMTIIESAVFSACSSLTTITIPNSITRIKDHAFSGCTGLTEIRSYIEKPFFSHQGSWYNVDKSIPLYVPAGTKVKYQTTEYWYEFTNIIEMGGETPNLDPTLIQFADTEVKRICVENWDTNGDGELSYDEAAAVTSIGTVFRNNKVMTTFDELEYFTGLTEIGDNAFSWSSIESVKIPNNVTHIGEQAFRGSGMSSPIIPKSVTSIGKEAFSYNWLNSIVVEAGNTVYDSRDNCNAIIHTATNELVQGCANTTIPNSVTSIGDAAFLGCDGLKSISIPSSVTTIGNFAFKECHYLTDVSIPNSVTTIGIEAFEITGLSSVVIPNSVTYIGNNAFWGCSMTSLTIPNSITTIESETFMYCKSLTSVIIPNSITSIGWNAFCYCSALASVTSFIEIPRAINDGVFEYLPEDATLYVPAGSKARYESTDGWKNFKNIVEMEAVTPDPNDPNIKFADAEVKRICVANWDTNGDHELSYDEAAAVKDLGKVFKDNLNIISFDELQYFTGLTTISERALASCLELTNITLPNSVTSIDTYALFDNYYLTSIIIPNSVTYIGRYAFCFCRGLANIVIPNSVTTIDEWAFDGCTKLSSVTIPNSVTSIGESAFFGCSNLNEVYSYIEKPYRVGCWASVDNCTLYVPAGTKAKYEATDGWKGFKNIVEMGGDEPVPDEPNEKIEAMKKDLEMETMKCMEMLHALSYELEKKDPEGVARELRQDLEYCAMYIKEAEYRVSICKTEDDIKDAQSQIEKMRAQLDYLNYQIEKLELEEPLTVTTVEGVKLTLKIISETEKTAQVGDGEKAALSQSTTGSVTIPASAGDYQIVAIAKWAFDGCHGLEAIHIPASVTSLSNNFLGNCRNLTSLTVAADNPVYNSPANSNAIVKTDNQTLVAACNSTVLPEGIVTIGEYAFAYCDAMDYLNLQGVSTFHDYAFAYSNVRIIATGDINQIGFSLGAFNCSKVEMFYIRQTDGTVSMFCNGTMWRNAYAPGWAAPTFTTYTVPDEVHLGNQSFIVSKLGHSAFSNCTQLTEVTIPATITAIEGKYAFNKCTALHTITSHIKNPFVIDSELFVDEVYANATLYVPAGTKAKYEVTDGWKNFKNIVEMGK